MVRTEKGRVVYARKKHEFKQADVDRIIKKLDELAADTTVWEAVQETFRTIWSYRKWTVPEAIAFYDEAFDWLDDMLGMLDEAIMFVSMLLRGKSVSYTPTKEGFHRFVAKMARAWADTIEGKR